MGGLIGEGNRNKSGLTIKRLTPIIFSNIGENKAIVFNPTNKYSMFNFVITSYINGGVTSSRVVGNMVSKVYTSILSGTTEKIEIYKNKNNIDIVILTYSNAGAEFRISFDACETESTIEIVNESSVDFSDYVKI